MIYIPLHLILNVVSFSIPLGICCIPRQVCSFKIQHSEELVKGELITSIFLQKKDTPQGVISFL